MEPSTFDHAPVLLAEVLDLVRPVPAGRIVDATLGGAGHATAILEARPDLTLLGLDRDPDALEAARRRLAPFGHRARTAHTRFDHLERVLADLDETEAGDPPPTTAVLFDLGVSSPQLDRAERGFSYRHDGPLDMRMDSTAPIPTAADLVNTSSVAELTRILRDHGDERFAHRIARRIVDNRPLHRTGELAALVKDAIPAATRRTGGHPATRTFQALRMAVNDELAVFETALDHALDVVAPGGRVLVISFHSGEDRITKHRFRRAETGDCSCPPRLPCVCGAEPAFRLLTRRGITAGEPERTTNPRAASARLRAVERLPSERTDEEPR